MSSTTVGSGLQSMLIVVSKVTGAYSSGVVDVKWSIAWNNRALVIYTIKAFSRIMAALRLPPCSFLAIACYQSARYSSSVSSASLNLISV